MDGILVAALVAPALEWVIAGYLMERHEPQPLAVRQGGGAGSRDRAGVLQTLRQGQRENQVNATSAAPPLAIESNTRAGPRNDRAGEIARVAKGRRNRKAG